ncbi:hypothetical protein [Enterococcus faecalis]|uniref:hypothetical protein n=1 Tax=Enterococcus faecalis TaxID=1351 RepID=UPI002DBF5456|nr:hypothetical protein [Enterococcus faecalis]MEB7792077.1 hypothetical protein [Enterococcus faecalis]MEB7810065.1 hypothetical protein [Enterococcus faecalis]
MKKINLLFVSLFIVGLSTSPVTTFAAEVDNDGIEEVQETVAITNLEMNSIESEVSVANKINLTTTATISMTGNFGNVTGTGKASAIMDNIYVKARIYNANGVMADQKTSSQNRTDYHSSKTANALVSFTKNYGFANATYKKSGYNTVSNETRVNQK